MGITFNTNLSALTAQRYIGIASGQASSSLAKLSSGSRVPQAKDDAAGLAIGSKLRAEVAGLTQAANNAAQAVTLLQIADGALSSIGDIVTRMKALATQASSGQLGDSERSLLNQEYSNLVSETNRIANVTNFNGTSILNGGDVGAESTELRNGGLSTNGISVTFDTSVTSDSDATNTTSTSDISDSFRIGYDYTNTTQDTGNLTVYNLRTGASQTIDITSYIHAITGETSTDLTTDLDPGRTVNISFGAVGVNVTIDSNFDVNTDIDSSAAETAGGSLTDATSIIGQLAVTNVNNGGLSDRVIKLIRTVGAGGLAAGVFNSSTGRFNLNIDEDDTTTTDTFNFTAIDNIRYAVNGAAGTENTATGALAENANFTIDVYFDDGTDSAKLFTIVHTAGSATTDITTDDTTNDYGIDFGNLVFGVDEVTGATKSYSFKVGTGTTSNDSITLTLSAATTSALGIASTTINTAANAGLAITALNSAITTVASRRADVGAAQSRLEFAANSINVAIENTTAATSALLDVDVSGEITTFTSKQVLLQAGISLLAQANQQPALLLRLLQ